MPSGLGWIHSGGGQDLTESLRRHTDVQPPADRQSVIHAGLHIGTSNRAVRPFEIVKVPFRLRLPVTHGIWRWKGAIFANPSNGYPVWAQAHVFSGHENSSSGEVKVVRDSLRPTVAWLRGSDAFAT